MKLTTLLLTPHFSLLTLLLTSHFSLLTCLASVPLRWTVETSRLQPVVFDVVRGETLALEADFKSYGKPVSTSNLTAFVCWQTNGMGSAWWVTNAVTAATVARAVFTPSMDPGAATVHGFIGLSASTNSALLTPHSALLTPHSALNYRAAFTLRYRHGPGATPNAIETPPRVLDLANTVVVNPPWPTQADFAATTTVMKAELKTYVDEQITGAGVVTPSITTNIAGRVASNVVTKAYVEGLGIETGIDTNAVRDIVAEATNAVPRIVSGENEIAADMTATIGRFWWPTNTPFGNDPIPGDSYLYLNPNTYPPSSSLMMYDGIKWVKTDYTGHMYQDDINPSPDVYYFDEDREYPTVRHILRTRLATTNDVSASSSQTLASAKTYADSATNGLATASTVSALATQVSAIGAHLNAEDAHFVSTNYDSAVRLPEAYVEIKMDGSWLTIWKEMTRWTRFVGDAFTWEGWGGLHAWMNNVTTELSFKADRSWGLYDSETGGYSPDGCTQISSSNILVAANMAFQKTVTSGGAVWVLQCNSGVAHVSGDTNGFFRIKDLDGVTQFEIVRGDKQELGADADGITVDPTTIPPTVTIPYSVEASEHPTLQICDELTSAQWKAETDPGCVANVTWTGGSGAYVATVRRKTAGDRLFVKATYMSGGETYIRNVAPVGMDAIMLNGTKFYLGTNVISGKLVLTLSTTPQNQ